MNRIGKLTREVADVHGSVQAVHLWEDDLHCNETVGNAKWWLASGRVTETITNTQDGTSCELPVQEASRRESPTCCSVDGPFTIQGGGTVPLGYPFCSFCCADKRSSALTASGTPAHGKIGSVQKL